MNLWSGRHFEIALAMYPYEMYRMVIIERLEEDSSLKDSSVKDSSVCRTGKRVPVKSIENVGRGVKTKKKTLAAAL